MTFIQFLIIQILILVDFEFHVSMVTNADSFYLYGNHFFWMSLLDLFSLLRKPHLVFHLIAWAIFYSCRSCLYCLLNFSRYFFFFISRCHAIHLT